MSLGDAQDFVDRFRERFLNRFLANDGGKDLKQRLTQVPDLVEDRGDGFGFGERKRMEPIGATFV